MRNGAWERGGGAWGLPACGLAGGGGERPPNSAGKEGAAPSSHPVGMRPGQPDPRSPGLSPRLRRGLGAASCAGLSPAGGCGGRNPFGAPRRGRGRPSGAAGKAAPDPLPPPGVRGPRHLAGCGAACTSLLACVYRAWGQGLGTCIVVGVRTWMLSPCLGQGRGTLARCLGAHHWAPVTLLRVRTRGCLRGVGTWGTLHRGRGWTWRRLRGAGGQDTGTLAWHLVSHGAPRPVLRMGLGCRSFASGLGLGLGDHLSEWVWQDPNQGEDLGTSASGSGLGDCSASRGSAAGSGGWWGQVASLRSLLAGIHLPRPWGPPHRPLLPLGGRGWLPSQSTTIPIRIRMRRWSCFNSPLSCPDPLP